MNICRIYRVAKRGSNPDIVIEVEGIRITLPLLSKEQRYRLASMVFGETDHVDLPCELMVDREADGIKDK